MPFMTDDQDQDSPTFGGSLPADLFDEPTSALPRANDPISEAAAARKLEELSLNGACQKISWSTTGSIAEITKDGQNVNIRALLRRRGTSQFELSNPVKLELPGRSFQYPLTHVSWSPTSHNGVLVVVGFTGSFALYSSLGSCNRLQPASLLTFPNDDPDAGCVAIHWLRTVKSLPLPGCIRTASKSNGLWSYLPVPEKLLGPLGPHQGLNSFLAVSKTHTIRLCYQGMRPPWAHLSESLGSCLSLDEMLTHASFAPYKENSVLLVTLDARSALRMYEITVTWNFPADQRNPPPPDFQLSPSMNITCLKTVQNFIPEVLSGSESLVKASHLLCLSAASENMSIANKQPIILATFTSVNQLHTASTVPNYSSKLIAYAVNEEKDALHESFKAMASQRSKKLGNTQRPIFVLTKLTDIDLLGHVMSAVPYQADAVVFLLKADGSCDVYDRNTNQIIDRDVSSDTIRGPLNTAYSFSLDDSYPECCLSPNACMVVRRESDDQVTLRRMEQIPTAADDRALAGLSMLSSSSCFLNVNNEDVLDRLMDLRESQNVSNVLLECFRSMPANFDFVADDSQQKVTAFLINHLVSKALSLVENLEAPKTPRGIPSKVASVMLELRCMCTTLQFAMGTHPGQSNTVDLASSIQGVVQWFVDLIAFLVDDLLEIRRDLSSNPTKDSIQTQVTQMNTPAVSLLLISSSRRLFRVACLFLRTFTERNNKVAGLIPPRFQPSWDKLVRTATDSPVNIFRFEEFLGGLHHYAKEAYDRAPTSDGDRSTHERHFLVTGTIPDVLEPLAKRLVTTSLDRYFIDEKVDQMKLFTTDVRHLNLTDDAETRRWWRGRKRCAFRKVDLAPGMKKWRQCGRCGRCTEEVGDVKSWPFWLQRLHRGCLCGSGWVVVEEAAA